MTIVIAHVHPRPQHFSTTPAGVSFRPRAHTSPIRRQTSSGSPSPRALDLISRGDGDMYDGLSGPDQWFVQG